MGTEPTNDSKLFDDLPDGAITLLQLSDSHIYADQDRCLVGINTQDSLDQVIALARQQLSTPDLLLATGDLVHDASAAGYQRIAERLSAFGCPVYCLPGNHDVPKVMQEHLNRPPLYCLPSLQRGNWSIIFLDSTIPGKPGGHLDDTQLELLSETLNRHPKHHTLITMHHHPVPVGSAWMDTMALVNPEPLFQLLEQHSQVRAVLFGHIHQEFDTKHRGIRLIGTPSTCIQFIAGQDKFGIDSKPPGYRAMVLLESGEIRTEVRLLQSLPLGLDLSSGGY
ncbi:3',5'-cyclic AMP phosphodiesterase CpdA [endosymbiont of Ridgeia piscesae]|uniref:3',5'-cyclic AMP phosphodiesterase CpdA n=2 Tax=endosymbiont of Ridgeia piscesae TaxID=54398 RepID=A0A0T5YSH9_9GAMM|nr:3',5'-cyclic-AMP phosphodiesterase [endosymbiont of Ridgeia piscesae]KRT53568.1 3',5'-cyclic AMP phosphodiesterase CpdA [endosymbiont of Ridgeia piscesae]KRT59432.1 Icc protein [endosymbiont of Ridgeia piscesae]